MVEQVLGPFLELGVGLAGLRLGSFQLLAQHDLPAFEVLKFDKSTVTLFELGFNLRELGLVLSMILSFPLASMQKEEEEVLTLIDAFCNEKLMPKLNDSKSDASDMLLSQAENIPAFAASLARAHELFLVKLQEATTLLSQAGETLSTHLDAHQTRVEGTFSNAVDKLTSETRDAILVPTRQLNEYFASLSKGVESLNGTLQKLGGETIVVQKRGFFSK